MDGYQHSFRHNLLYLSIHPFPFHKPRCYTNPFLAPHSVPYVQNVFNELFDALEKKLTKLDTPTWLRWTREKTKNLPTIPKYLQRTLIIILLPLLAFPAL